MARSGVLAKAVRIEPRSAERASAEAVRKAVSAKRGRIELVLRLPDGTTMKLPKGLVEVVAASAGELAEGHAVTVLPSEVMLTPAEAATLLGLSRPFVARLLDGGEIPAERLPRSRHRRVRLSDVLAFQARRERRRSGRRAIADAVEAAGLPY